MNVTHVSCAHWIAAIAFVSLTFGSGIGATQAQRDAPTPPPAKGSASISGTVVSVDAGRGIRRAVVMVAGGSPRGVHAVESDEQGNFSVTHLTAGDYLISVTKPGYLESVFGQKQPGSGRPGVPIKLAEGQRLTRLSLPLARGGAITGTVLDEVGEPVFGVSVRALMWVMRSGERTLQAAGLAVTDDRGVYRLNTLTPGDYQVSVSPGTGLTMAAIEGTAYTKLITAIELNSVETANSRAGAPAERNPSASGFATVYYPGTTIGSAAETVSIGAGEERAGINIPLHVVPLSRIVGTVTTQGGPGTSVNVQLIEPGPMAGVTARTVRTDSAGRFVFGGVRPGEYLLVSKGVARGSARLEASGREAAQLLATINEKGGVERVAAAISAVSPLWAMANVVVDGRGELEVPLVLQPGITVSGRVTTDDGSRAANLARLTLGLAPVGLPKTPNDFAQAGPAPLDADGQFSIKGVVPGRYRVIAIGGLPSGFSIDSAVFEGQDILDVPLEIDGSRNVGAGLVTLSARSSEVTGRIQDQSNQAAPGFTVIAYAVEERFWTPESRRIQAVRPSTDGSYTVRNLPPGNYRLIAVPDVETGRWYDPAYLRQLSGFAALTVSAGAKYTQDFRVK